MSDDAKDDRKDALSSRFNAEEDKTSRTSKTSNAPQTYSTEKASSTDKTSSAGETATTEKTSLSDKSTNPERPSTRDRRAVTMYLPEELVTELDLQFQELSLEMQREHDREIEKNADYYPALIRAASRDGIRGELTAGLGRNDG
jgi:hypothetical protein